MIEYEAKILDVDPGDIAKRVLNAGGRVVGGGLQRRYVYDIDPTDQSRWIRLRETAAKTTLAVKVIHHDGIDGVEEVEVEVDDFVRTARLLELQGFHAKAYQENRRTSYLLHGAEVEVDEWPMLPPYVEIEGHDQEHVVEIASLLGYGLHELTTINTQDLYAKFGIDLTEYPVLRF